MEPSPMPSLPPLTTTSAAIVGASTASKPAAAAAAATVVSPHVATLVPDSVDSSPKLRATDVWDDPPAQNGGACTRIRLMCSYGGHIVPRPHDKVLAYLGGDTRIVVVDRGISLSALLTRLSNTYLNGRPFTLKYQLPGEDLDSLISITTDEDLDNMIDEYQRTVSSSSSVKPSRLRLFLFPKTPDSTQSMVQIIESAGKSDDWFLNALNNAGLLNRGFSDSTSVNNLLGLDDVVTGGTDIGVNRGNLDLVGARDGDGGNSLKNAEQHIPAPTPPQQGRHDVHSVPGSPELTTSSSFGSTSSSPSIANLPPIRVHVEEASGAKPMQDQKLGIEDQFCQINVGGRGGAMQKQQQEEGFAVISSPPPPMPTTIAVSGAPVSSAAVSSDYHTRKISDDERSEQGLPIAYGKPPTPKDKPQNLLQPTLAQQRPNGGVHDLPSPDSVSSDNSLNNPLSGQQPAIYQDPVVQTLPGSNMVANNNAVDRNSNASDPNARVQIMDSTYLLQHQFGQQTQSQAQPQQHPQFMQAASHLLQHHPTGVVPIPAYFPVYPPQPRTIHRQHLQLDQQSYPVYYVTAPVPARQAQGYNVPVQQSDSMSEAPQPGSILSSHTQAPSDPIRVAHRPNGSSYNPVRNAAAGHPEVGSGGAYRTITGTGGAHLVQVPLNQLQQQFLGYSQMHHQAQSVVAPGPGGNVNYGYEFADPAHAQMYFSQPLSHAQYQTMVLPDGSTAKLPTENIKPQVS